MSLAPSSNARGGGNSRGRRGGRGRGGSRGKGSTRRRGNSKAGTVSDSKIAGGDADPPVYNAGAAHHGSSSTVAPVTATPKHVQSAPKNAGSTSQTPAPTALPDADQEAGQIADHGKPPREAKPLSKLPCSLNHDLHPTKKKRRASLVHTAEISSLRELTKAPHGHGVAEPYCCGGHVPVATRIAPTTGSEEIKHAFKLAIRLGDSESNRWSDFVFPCEETRWTSFEMTLKSLEEKTRPDGNLLPHFFVCDFDPYYHGIVDAITQILFPFDTLANRKDMVQARGVSVKLSSLFVQYSDTAGRVFPAANSNRRSRGKLVVCLPSHRRGGSLKVLRNGDSTAFDWSKKDPTGVQWAAWVGDCTQELEPLQKGSRPLLIFDILENHRMKEITTLVPESYSLYSNIKKMLEQPGFLKDGAELGFYCQHNYSHVNSTHTRAANKATPCLRGVDKAIYSIFKSLHCSTVVKPLLHPLALDAEYQVQWLSEKQLYESDREQYRQKYLTHISKAEYCDDAKCNSWPKFPDLETWRKNRTAQFHIVGKELHDLKYAMCQVFFKDGTSKELDENVLRLTEVFNQLWPWDQHDNVTWMNTPSRDGWQTAVAKFIETSAWNPETEEPSFTNMVKQYGSHLVIFIEVPNWAVRAKTFGTGPPTPE